MTGAIPDSFFGLSELIVLGLDDNLLETNIANFARFPKIQKLYIEGKIFSLQSYDFMSFFNC